MTYQTIYISDLLTDTYRFIVPNPNLRDEHQSLTSLCYKLIKFQMFSLEYIKKISKNTITIQNSNSTFRIFTITIDLHTQ